MIAATIEVIDESGEVAVRVQDIVTRVGTQAPVLYRHFGSREGLVMAAQAKRLVDDMNAEVDRFSQAFRSAATAEEFEVLVELLMVGITGPERRDLRWKRVNVIGSTYGRPELAEAVAVLLRRTISGIAAGFRPAQQRGWISDDVDLNAVAAWLAGHALGRILIELGDSDVSDEAWNKVALKALKAILFG